MGHFEVLCVLRPLSYVVLFLHYVLIKRDIRLFCTTIFYIKRGLICFTKKTLPLNTGLPLLYNYVICAH